MVSAYFLSFDNWIFKEWKTEKKRTTLSQHTNYSHKWLAHVNFDVFTAAVFFFWKIPKDEQAQNNIISRSMGWLTWLTIIRMVKAGPLAFMRSEIFS